MDLIREAFEAAKKSEASTKTQTSNEEKLNTEVKASEPSIAELQTKLDSEKKMREKAETEYMRLMGEFSENTKVTQKLLNEIEGIKGQVKAQPQGLQLSEQEFNQLMAENPKKALEYFAGNFTQKVQQESESKNSTVLKDLYAKLHASEVNNIKLFLQNKYDLPEDEWKDMAKFGDKYPEYTQNISDPEHAEAFYKFYKVSKKEVPKEKTANADMYNVLKKIQGFVDSGNYTPGESASLSVEEEEAAKNLKMTPSDYQKFKQPQMNYFDYLKLKQKEKSNG